MYVHVFDIATLSPATTLSTITDGVCTRLQYPAADATDANPVVCEFAVKTGALGVS